MCNSLPRANLAVITLFFSGQTAGFLTGLGGSYNLPAWCSLIVSPLQGCSTQSVVLCSHHSGWLWLLVLLSLYLGVSSSVQSTPHLFYFPSRLHYLSIPPPFLNIYLTPLLIQCWPLSPFFLDSQASLREAGGHSLLCSQSNPVKRERGAWLGCPGTLWAWLKIVSAGVPP